MWLITRMGFFSVVRKSTDIERGTLTVRARVNIPDARSRESIYDSLILGPCNFISVERRKLAVAKWLPPQ